MKPAIFLTTLLSVCWGCQAQQSGDTATDREAGGPCEGCEALFEYGNKVLGPVDTMPGFGTISPALMVTGTIYEADGRTPAEGVILYIYHTNRDGRYTRQGNETGWGTRHGMFRGWVKTGADGRYTFYTFRPGSYPNGSEPEHIHATVKKPGIIPYYLDSYHFDDDPLLASKHRQNRLPRGGSGIVTLRQEGELLIAERDIILGKNIPGY